MKPERPDIAAPPFPPGLDWVGGEPPAMERLCAKGPVLVHFFEASEASSFRSLDWIRDWQLRYRALGLNVVGVHTPRSDFARETGELAHVCAGLDLHYPVANDAERRVWRDYGCRGWPSLFLWRRGGALVWVHFGEGEYQASERAIRAELGDAELPEAAEAGRPSDAEHARVLEPSAELFPGGSHGVPLEGAGEPLEVEYEAGAVYAAVSGSGEVAVSIDGQALDPISVSGPVTVELADHGRHGSHLLTLTPASGALIWSIGFGAGVP